MKNDLMVRWFKDTPGAEIYILTRIGGNKARWIRAHKADLMRRMRMNPGPEWFQVARFDEERTQRRIYLTNPEGRI